MQNPKRQKNFLKKAFVSVALVSTLAISSGCAYMGGMELSSKKTNIDLFETPHKFKVLISKLKPGMSLDDVYTRLARVNDTMDSVQKAKAIQKVKKSWKVMDRNDIRNALYGNNTQLQGSLESLEKAREHLSSLEGLSIRFRDTTDTGGFALTEFRSTEEGFDYAAYLIFKNGQLLEKPIISGGYNKETDSVTYPGVLWKSAKNIRIQN